MGEVKGFGFGTCEVGMVAEEEGITFLNTVVYPLVIVMQSSYNFIYVGVVCIFFFLYNPPQR